ncbi:MAG: biotin/lipoate--protein ligase family protein [Pikeienuella sp.]
MGPVIDAPRFPPLLVGEEAAAGQDPFAKAVARAALGTEAGRVVWSSDLQTARAAMVLAPEVALELAVTVAFAHLLGLGDAMGALAPPETAVHFDWPAGLRVNAARCGGIRAAAATQDLAAVPGWLVIGIEVPIKPPAETAPGRAPDRTWLCEEGCGEITAPALIDTWARHTLLWINTWEERGIGPLHEAWRARAWGLGEPLADGSGVFMGLDETCGQLIKTATGTELRRLAPAILGGAMR